MLRETGREQQARQGVADDSLHYEQDLLYILHRRQSGLPMQYLHEELLVLTSTALYCWSVYMGLLGDGSADFRSTSLLT